LQSNSQESVARREISNHAATILSPQLSASAVLMGTHLRSL